jgi:hypothetical protein
MCKAIYPIHFDFIYSSPVYPNPVALGGYAESHHLFLFICKFIIHDFMFVCQVVYQMLDV